MKFITGLMAALLAVSAQAIEWTPSLKAALDQAKKDGKNVLLIVGSEDSKNTKDFLQNVATDEFKKKIADLGYVIVTEIDSNKTPFGHDTELVMREFGVTNYPSFVTMDSDGRAFAILPSSIDPASVPDLPATYLKVFGTMLTFKANRDKALSDANAKQGAERIKALHMALIGLTKVGLFMTGEYYGYKDAVDEVVNGDANNALGIRVQWDIYKLVGKCNQAYRQNEFDLAQGAMDDFLKAYPADKARQQQALMIFCQFCATMRCDTELEQSLNKIVEIDPTSEAGKHAAKVLADAAAMKQKDQEGDVKLLEN